MIEINADTKSLRAALELAKLEVRAMSARAPIGVRARKILWRIGCALSNPVVRIDHCLYSSPRGMEPLYNGHRAPRISAMAMVSVFGWGAFWCHRMDRHGRHMVTAGGLVLKH